jgi:hypothetical protein
MNISQMTPQQFESLSEIEFHQLVESYIMAVTQGAYDLPADIFLALWLEQRVVQIAETTYSQ